ncbi:DUF3313 family protein [Maricaulis sp. CAU 1757]
MTLLRAALLPSLLAVLVTGCAANDVQRAHTLSRYDQMETTTRRLLPVNEWVDAQALADVSTIHVADAGLAPGVVEASGVEAERIERVQAKLTQTMCRRLARGGFTVTPDPDGAELSVVMTITGFEPTDMAAAGASRVLGFAVPGPLSPRLPIGIGALAAEGEVLTRDQRQVAAMQWVSRNHILSGGGFSEIGDGYDLAQVFADSFGDLIVDARDSVDGPRGETAGGVCNDMFDAIVGDDVAAN